MAWDFHCNNKLVLLKINIACLVNVEVLLFSFTWCKLSWEHCNKVLLSAIPDCKCFQGFTTPQSYVQTSGQKTKSQESQRRLLIQIKHMGTCAALHHMPHTSLTKNHDPGK